MTNLNLRLIISYKQKQFFLDETFDYILDIGQDFSLKILFFKLMKKDINIRVLKVTSFIYRGKKLSIDNLEKKLDVKNNELINIVANNNENKLEICKKLFPKIYNEINNSDLEKVIETKITKQDINNQDNSIDDYIYDNDFKFLLNIFLNKPNLFSKLSQYVNSGDIITKLPVDNSEQYHNNNILNINMINILEQYNDNCNLGFSTEYLHKILQKFDNNLNLSLRYLVHQNILNKN